MQVICISGELLPAHRLSSRHIGWSPWYWLVCSRSFLVFFALFRPVGKERDWQTQEGEVLCDHCINHALSDPLEIQFQQACTDHQHDVGCDRCQLLPEAVLNLKEILSNLADLSPNTREELFMDIDAAVTKILQWKSHIIRTINQDTARTHTLKDLQPGDILIIMDWAKKFLPITFRKNRALVWPEGHKLACVCVHLQGWKLKFKA